MRIVHPPSIESLIDRQARSWEVRSRLAAEGGEAARRELVHLAEGPWLTVSRQLGSGGLEIARRVGERLGWQVYDKQILETIAEHRHLRSRVVQRLDERVIGWISEYVTHLLTPQSLPQAAFAKDLSEVLVALGRQGRAVIVGRGGNWLLDARYGLRVRFVAPVDRRVEAVGSESGLSREAAEREVREHDARTAAFVRQTFGRGIDDPLGYDLVVNTGATDVDAATAIVVEGLRRKLGGA